MTEDNAKPPFTNCPTCGVPQIDDLKTLVLYFASVEDCREAAALLKEALPQSFEGYTTEGKVDG